MQRSYDHEVLKSALSLVPEMNIGLDCEAWLNSNNYMLVDGDNVGLGTYEYPGCYTLHWFFNVRGREAYNLAKRMLDYFFTDTDCKIARGITPMHIKGARWLARQVGFTSLGVVECLSGPHELFCLTKEDFYKDKK